MRYCKIILGFSVIILNQFCFLIAFRMAVYSFQFPVVSKSRKRKTWQVEYTA